MLRRHVQYSNSFHKSAKKRQITILLATHDFAVVRHHAQQVLWFHQGKMHHGTADELLNLKRMAEIFEMGIG